MRLIKIAGLCLTAWATTVAASGLDVKTLQNSNDLFQCRIRVYGSAATRAPMTETQADVGAQHYPFSDPSWPSNYAGYYGTASMSTKINELGSYATLRLNYAVVMDLDKDGNVVRAVKEVNLDGSFAPTLDGALIPIGVNSTDPFNSPAWQPAGVVDGRVVLSIGNVTTYAESPGSQAVLQTSCWDATNNSNPPPPPPPAQRPTCSLVVTPTTVMMGDTVTIAIKSANAVYATIDGTSVPVPAGTKVITATTAGTFTAVGTVTGPAGSATCGAAYVVEPEGPPPPHK